MDGDSTSTKLGLPGIESGIEKILSGPRNASFDIIIASRATLK